MDVEAGNDTVVEMVSSCPTSSATSSTTAAKIATTTTDVAATGAASSTVPSSSSSSTTTITTVTDAAGTTTTSKEDIPAHLHHTYKPRLIILKDRVSFDSEEDESATAATTSTTTTIGAPLDDKNDILLSSSTPASIPVVLEDATAAAPEEQVPLKRGRGRPPGRGRGRRGRRGVAHGRGRGGKAVSTSVSSPASSTRSSSRIKRDVSSSVVAGEESDVGEDHFMELDVDLATASSLSASSTSVVAAVSTANSSLSSTDSSSGPCAPHLLATASRMTRSSASTTANPRKALSRSAVRAVRYINNYKNLSGSESSSEDDQKVKKKIIDDHDEDSDDENDNNASAFKDSSHMSFDIETLYPKVVRYKSTLPPSKLYPTSVLSSKNDSHPKPGHPQQQQQLSAHVSSSANISTSLYFKRPESAQTAFAPLFCPPPPPLAKSAAAFPYPPTATTTRVKATLSSASSNFANSIHKCHFPNCGQVFPFNYLCVLHQAATSSSSSSSSSTYQSSSSSSASFSSSFTATPAAGLPTYARKMDRVDSKSSSTSTTGNSKHVATASSSSSGGIPSYARMEVGKQQQSNSSTASTAFNLSSLLSSSPSTNSSAPSYFSVFTNSNTITTNSIYPGGAEIEDERRQKRKQSDPFQALQPGMYSNDGIFSSSVMDNLSFEKDKLCNMCGQAFTRLSHLKRHMDIHNANRMRNFVCQVPDCHKAYPTKWGLTQHQQKHTGGGYRCEFCRKKFTYKRYIVAHLKFCTRIPYSRAHAGAVAASMSLSSSSSSMSCLKPLECGTCGSKNFSNSYQMWEHVKVCDILTNLKRRRRTVVTPALGPTSLPQPRASQTWPQPSQPSSLPVILASYPVKSQAPPFATIEDGVSSEELCADMMQHLLPKQSGSASTAYITPAPTPTASPSPLDHHSKNGIMMMAENP